jgi:hypothetical protein
MGSFLGIWIFLVFLVLLNGFAAGTAAVLHVWRSGQSRQSRAVTAAAITGLVPAIMMIPAIIAQGSFEVPSLVGSIVGIAVLCGLTMAVSLPGALIIARKLDGPGNAYAAFE